MKKSMDPSQSRACGVGRKCPILTFEAGRTSFPGAARQEGSGDHAEPPSDHELDLINNLDKRTVQ